MSRPSEFTIPYPAHVDAIEAKVRKAAVSPDHRVRLRNREFVREVLTHEYRSRRPRYSLIRFLKAHR